MSIIYFILILSIVVFIHELGHLIAAKSFGVYCSEFALGFGPKLFSYKKKGSETTYSLRAIPFGGFVQMAGEEGTDEMDVPLERTIKGIKKYKKIIIMLAGIIMNILLAYTLFTGMFAIQGSYSLPPEATISTVTEGSPAEIAGLKAGDKIVKLTFVDGTYLQPSNFMEIVNDPRTSTGDTIIYSVERSSETLDFSITPLFNKDENRYLVGIGVPPGEVIELGFVDTFKYGIQQTNYVIVGTFNGVVNLFRGVGLDQLSGPIGILQVTGDTMNQASSFKEAVLYFMNLVAVISVSVALMNLLPIPAFDGGRVFLTIVEIIIRKPLNKRAEEILIGGSFLLLVMLLVVISFKDIMKIFS